MSNSSSTDNLKSLEVEASGVTACLIGEMQIYLSGGDFYNISTYTDKEGNLLKGAYIDEFEEAVGVVSKVVNY